MNENYTSENQYILIRVTGEEAEDLPSHLEKAAEDTETKQRWIILECGSVQKLRQATLAQLLGLSRGLRKSNVGVRLVLPSSRLAAQLRDAGLTSTFPVFQSVKAAVADLVPVRATKGFDVNLINPFLEATVSVLKTQATTSVSAQEIYTRTNSSGLGDISGVIGLVSDGFTGSVILSFPKQTFLTILSRMLGETFTEITPEIQDGASELTNIIFGQAKAGLNGKGHNIKMALPSVVVGKDHVVLSGTLGPRVVIPFHSDAGPFFIELSLS